MMLEEQFKQDLLQDEQQVQDEYGYNAVQYRRMIQKHGGVQAAKIILLTAGMQKHLTKLRELKRLDLSMEARVLQPQYAPLFSSKELQTARQRLADLD